MTVSTDFDVQRFLSKWADPTDPWDLVMPALGEQQNPGSDMYPCPAHTDDRDSLQVNRGDFVYYPTITCHAGCTKEKDGRVVKALGLSVDQSKGELTLAHHYRDLEGIHVYTVNRQKIWIPGEGKYLGDAGTVDRVGGKKIWYSHIGSKGEIVRSYPRGQERILYNAQATLDAAREGRFVVIAEGEKAADIGAEYCAQSDDKLADKLTFTAFAGGASAELTEGMLDVLTAGLGARVVVWRDLDELKPPKPGQGPNLAGVQWALNIHDALVARGVSEDNVRIVRSATDGGGDDIHEHLKAGFDLQAAVREKIPYLRGLVHDNPMVMVSGKLGIKRPVVEVTWPVKPQDVALEIIARHYTIKVEDDSDRPHLRTSRVLREYEGDLYSWSREDGHWRKRSSEWLQSEIQLRLANGVTKSVKDENVKVPVNAGAARLLELSKLIRLRVNLDHADVGFGSWLVEGEDEDPTAEEENGRWVACENGLLEIGSRTLRNWTPEFFNVHRLPFSFPAHLSHDEIVKLAQPMIDFEHLCWGPRSAEARLNREWWDVVETGDRSMHKLMFLFGPPSAGKGTMARAMQYALGEDACKGTSMSSIASQFGLAPLVGKTLAIFGDVHFEGAFGEGSRAVEAILSITGQDPVHADRKYKDPWNGRMSAALMMMSNKMPNLQEASGALVSRFLTLHFPIGHTDDNTEDHGIAERILDPEVIGAYLVLCLNAGAERRARPGMAFTVPASSLGVLDKLRAATDNTGTFARERFVVKADGWAAPGDIWMAWNEWCVANGVKAGSRRKLIDDLQSGRWLGDRRQRRVNGKRVWGYDGLELSTIRLET